MLSRTQGVVANHQPGSEVDNQAHRLTAAIDQALQGDRQQIYARRRSSIDRRKTKLAEQSMAFSRVAARFTQHTEAHNRVPAEYMGITSSEQGVAYCLVEALSSDGASSDFT